MTEPVWYRAPGATVRQGDVVQLPPLFRALKKPVEVVDGPRETRKGGRVTVELKGGAGKPIPPKVLAGGKTAYVVPGRFAAFGVLLSRGCEIDHGNHRQIVPLFPLEEIQGDGQTRSAEENQAAIIAGEHVSLHYMPAVPSDIGEYFGESFLDFRYITTLRLKFLAKTSAS